MSIVHWLLSLMLLAHLPPPQIGPLPGQWRGIWASTSGSTGDLQLVRVSADTVQIVWRGARAECVPTGEGVQREPLVSLAFRCETAGGTIRMALTSLSGSVLLAHIAAPNETTLRVVELRRGETAAPAPPPPAPPAAEKPPIGPGPVGIMPQFPWPPPRWTARAVLPPGMVVTVEGEPLGSAFDRLRVALRRAGIPEWSVYAIGSDGFAVVSRLEAILDDGRPTADRWSAEPVRPRIFSLSDYITALFKATPGRYRILIFVVTALPVTASPESMDAEAMEQLLRAGAGELSAELRRARLQPSGRCEALVYEFFRPSEDDRPAQVASSRITVPQHLIGAGIWSTEELSR